MLDDEDDDEDPKSFAELVEENAFAIETSLYLLFLVLFTCYAVLAQGLLALVRLVLHRECVHCWNFVYPIRVVSWHCSSTAGNSNNAYAMGEQIRRIYLPFKSITDTASWFASSVSSTACAAWSLDWDEAQDPFLLLLLLLLLLLFA